MINRQLDWLQVFTVCDDWASLNQVLLRDGRVWTGDSSVVSNVLTSCLLGLGPNPGEHQFTQRTKSSASGDETRRDETRRASAPLTSMDERTVPRLLPVPSTRCDSQRLTDVETQKKKQCFVADTGAALRSAVSRSSQPQAMLNNCRDGTSPG